MGTTYRARDTVLHRTVALKVIGGTLATHPEARERFLREARAAAQFQHPNVAAVSQYGEQEGECFYAMELVEGETLEARIARDGPLPVAETLEIVSQVAQALAAAEARGIIHRDLKPTNLMLAQPDEASGEHAPLVKVIDFGLAKAVSAAAETSGAGGTRGFVGTPSFASPEQFAGSEEGRIDHRSDIYALGATLWYVLTGRVPFVGSTLDEIHRRQFDALPIEQLTAQKVPRIAVTLLSSMLSADPAKRPQSARELLERLERCQQDARLPPAKRTARWGLAVLALAAFAVVGGIWLIQRAPTVTRFGRLDVAVNNAGTEGQPGPVVEQTTESFAATFDTNVLGTLLSMKHELRVMLPQGSGSIINLSSTLGKQGAPGASVYTASKHAVEGLTKVAALEAAESGVRVNLVAPGPIDTGMLPRFTGTDEYKAGLIAGVPVKRMGKPEEVAQAILFLARDQWRLTGLKPHYTPRIEWGWLAQ